MNKLYTLSEDDVRILRGLVDRERNRVQNTQGRTLLDQPPLASNGQFVALVPTTIAGRSSLTISGVECTIYQRVEDALIDAGFERTVYNLDTDAVAENSFVLIRQDNWGTWWTDGSPLSPVGTGTGDGGGGASGDIWSTLTNGIMVNADQGGYGIKTLWENLSFTNTGWEVRSELGNQYTRQQFDRMIVDSDYTNPLEDYSEMLYNGYKIHCPSNSNMHLVNKSIGNGTYTVTISTTGGEIFGEILDITRNSHRLSGGDFYYDALEWNSGTSYVTNDRANITDATTGLIQQYRATANNSNDEPPSANWVATAMCPNYAHNVTEGFVVVRKHGVTMTLAQAISDGCKVIGGIITPP